jgi:hypothetical protein
LNQMHWKAAKLRRETRHVLTTARPFVKMFNKICFAFRLTFGYSVWKWRNLTSAALGNRSGS